MPRGVDGFRMALELGRTGDAGPDVFVGDGVGVFCCDVDVLGCEGCGEFVCPDGVLGLVWLLGAMGIGEDRKEKERIPCFEFFPMRIIFNARDHKAGKMAILVCDDISETV